MRRCSTTSKVSIAFRLNARTVARPAPLTKSYATGVSIAFRLNARTVVVDSTASSPSPFPVSIAFRLNARTVGGDELGTYCGDILVGLNCLSAQCSNGSRPPGGRRAPHSTPRLNCLSAQCSNGSTATLLPLLLYMSGLNCLSAQCSNGSPEDEACGDCVPGRVSIAFRLNARTVDRERDVAVRPVHHRSQLPFGSMLER